MDDHSRRLVLTAVQSAATSGAPLLLAVSGGLDSMALFHAMHRVAPDRIAAVATFDHGTGPEATRAAAFVAARALERGVRCVSGRLSEPLPSGSIIGPRIGRGFGQGISSGPAGGREAAWRRARYAFLHEEAARLGGRIVTAHTEDDHLETVMMRILRGSGTRGLAGLLAPSAILRPFVALRRETLERFARAEHLTWMEDPSNESRAFLRNRVRHDLLPALAYADARLERSLLDLAARAAAWRADVDRFVDEVVRPARRGSATLMIAGAELRGYDRDSLAMLWVAICGRVGLALDRRGTSRLAAFTMKEPRSGSVPLSGDWCLEAHGDHYVLRQAAMITAPALTLPVTGTAEWGRFRFKVSDVAISASSSSNWAAALPAETRLVVRCWTAGDRLSRAEGQGPRRVARYLSDARVRGRDRLEWPVVASEDDVVWIPGVRRSDAATDRSGRPVRHYLCERLDR